VVATVLGVVVLGEIVSTAAWLGVALVLAGLALQAMSLAGPSARRRGAG
jgi:drug/metabolite transporter (DMT)-like permease